MIIHLDTLYIYKLTLRNMQIHLKCLVLTLWDMQDKLLVFPTHIMINAGYTEGVLFCKLWDMQDKLRVFLAGISVNAGYTSCVHFYTLKDMQDTLEVFLAEIMINAGYISGVYVTHEEICMNIVGYFWQKLGQILWNIYFIRMGKGPDVIHLFIVRFLPKGCLSGCISLLFGSSPLLCLLFSSLFHSSHVPLVLKIDTFTCVL